MDGAPKSNRLMPIKAAAEYLGVSQYFLRQGIKNDTVPHIRSGNKFYIAVDVLMDTLRNNVVITK